jgi:CRISPR/Cas system-associated exonuclease Cas4 (RecB family)
VVTNHPFQARLLMDLLNNPTIQIIDASKLQDYMQCPRRYFFRHVLGWSSELPNVHLDYGTAIHKSMEVLYPIGQKPDYSPDNVFKAYSVFLEHYRSVFPEETDFDREPKTPANTWRLLNMYADKYKDLDKFTTLFSEVAGSVHIKPNGNDKVYFRSDLVVEEDPYGVYSLEHKTSQRSFSKQWLVQWPQKMQVGVYNHFLHCYFENPYGVHVNGLYVTRPPKMKKDGSPYANSTDCDFTRVMIRRNDMQMQDWLWQVNYWYDELQRDYQRLSECTEGQEVMTAFPKRTESCSDYFGCLYADYCLAWPNPLKRCQECPIGMKVEHWNPLQLVEDAKVKVDL